MPATNIKTITAKPDQANNKWMRLGSVDLSWSCDASAVVIAGSLLESPCSVSDARSVNID
jgi:hypothetical protein